MIIIHPVKTVHATEVISFFRVALKATLTSYSEYILLTVQATEIINHRKVKATLTFFTVNHAYQGLDMFRWLLLSQAV